MNVLVCIRMSVCSQESQKERLGNAARKMRAKQIMEDWGVVQELIIEADTGIALRAACEIAFTEHPSGCSHYRIDGGALVLLWSAEDGALELPFDIESPDALKEFVSRWLAQAEYPEAPDTDGSTKEGFRFENAHGYVFVKVIPTWIVYGK